MWSGSRLAVFFCIATIQHVTSQHQKNEDGGPNEDCHLHETGKIRSYVAPGIIFGGLVLLTFWAFRGIVQKKLEEDKEKVNAAIKNAPADVKAKLVADMQGQNLEEMQRQMEEKANAAGFCANPQQCTTEEILKWASTEGVKLPTGDPLGGLVGGDYCRGITGSVAGAAR